MSNFPEHFIRWVSSPWDQWDDDRLPNMRTMDFWFTEKGRLKMNSPGDNGELCHECPLFKRYLEAWTKSTRQKRKIKMNGLAMCSGLQQIGASHNSANLYLDLNEGKRDRVMGELDKLSLCGMAVGLVECLKKEQATEWFWQPWDLD